MYQYDTNSKLGQKGRWQDPLQRRPAIVTESAPFGGSRRDDSDIRSRAISGEAGVSAAFPSVEGVGGSDKRNDRGNRGVAGGTGRGEQNDGDDVLQPAAGLRLEPHQEEDQMSPPRRERGVITLVKYDRGPMGISIGPGGVILGIHQNK